MKVEKKVSKINKEDEENCSNDGSKKRKCIEVYYDKEKGTESYVLDGWLVVTRVGSNGTSGSCFHDISGYEKILASHPPSSPKPVSCSSDPRYEEEEHRQAVDFAEEALAYYNKKHHTDYKLVDALGSHSTKDECWTHGNFEAKPATAPDGVSGYSSIKLFFAERKKVRPGCYVITACCILEGVETGSTCGMCPYPWFSHPTHGFRKGLYTRQPRVLRSRTRCMENEVR